MKEQVAHVIEPILKFWEQQEKKRKIFIISIFALVIIFSIILALVLNNKNYVILFDKLESKEAGEIVAVMQTMEVDYQVKGDGKILINEEQEDSVRMQLATQGYPKSSLNYDFWFNNINMFSTESEKQELKKIQLQERLQATIKTLSGVEDAIVNLDIPTNANTVINSNKKVPTASIVIHVQDSLELSKKQISGIKHIVKMSVADLTTENISITDGTGKLLLEEDSSSDEMEIEEKKFQFKKQFEDAIRTEILGLLTPAYKDKITVSPNALLNYDKELTEDTQYTPSVGDDGMVQHEDKNESGSKPGNNGNTVGEDPNAEDTYPTVDDDSSEDEWYENSSSTSYLVNTLKKQTEKQGFSIDNISVSVVIYKDTTMSEEEKADIVELVSTAAGTKASEVHVSSLPTFGDTIPTINDVRTYLFGLTLNQLLIIAGVVLILIIIFILIFAGSISRSRKKKQKLLAELNTAAQVENGFVQEEFNLKSLSDELPETKDAAVRREIGEFAETNPEIVAQLLKNWLREEGE